MARKENWRQEEIHALVECVADRIDIMKGKFSPFLTAEKKTRAWDEVLESFTQRDVKSVKKKWIDIQSKTKKREAERRRDQKKTGGGPPPVDLKPWEDKIISILDDTMVVGIEGGFDTSECGDTIMLRDCSTKSKKGRSLLRQQVHQSLDNSKADILLKIQKEKLELKRDLPEIEKEKFDVLKEICLELKRKNCCCPYSIQTLDPLVELEPVSCSVSPTIKGLVVKEV